MNGGALIDLNADVGERPDAVAQDRLILRSVSSANVACGFHAGTTQTMREMCEAAVALGVVVGAHFSYADREAFGREELEVAPALLAAQVTEQICTLQSVARSVGADVRYVKAHGALYNRTGHDPWQAAAVAAGVKAVPGAPLPVLCLPGAVMIDAAASYGLMTVSEGFSDRGYLPNGALAPRSEPGGVLGQEAAIAQAIAIACQRPITTIDGSELALRVRSLCLHSDTPGAPGLATTLRRELEQAGVRVQAFA